MSVAADPRILVKPAPIRVVVVTPGPPWRPCPDCWGQRRQWAQTPEGWWVRPCPRCLGIGDIPSVTNP